jgi:hypothetical protein
MAGIGNHKREKEEKMFCAACGKEINGEQKFCDQCGAQLPAVAPTGSAPVALILPPAPKMQEKNGDSGKWLIVGVVCLSVLVLAGYVVAKKGKNGGDITSSSASKGPVLTVEEFDQILFKVSDPYGAEKWTHEVNNLRSVYAAELMLSEAEIANGIEKSVCHDMRWISREKGSKDWKDGERGFYVKTKKDKTITVEARNIVFPCHMIK